LEPTFFTKFKIGTKINNMLHELKVDKKFFYDLEQGRKTFEIRFNDRDFKVGDRLSLREWDSEKKEYTKNFMSPLSRRITYILEGGQYGIEKGYVILQLK
jgi:hypothetical protein